jgi:chaperone required for assembly of F1-ATPase
MKRFWKEVAVTADLGIALDSRPVRTPGRVPLALPTPALADAVAAEWRAVGDTLEPRAMPLTGLANAAIDRVAPDPAAFARGIAAYGESDLLCYRADTPAELVALEAEAWNPPLAWAKARYDVHFEVVSGVLHQSQPPTTLTRLGEAVAALDPFALAPLSTIVSVTGSLVLGLALAERAIESAGAWDAADVDAAWQRRHWGEDALATAALAERRAAYDAAVRFLNLGR